MNTVRALTAAACAAVVLLLAPPVRGQVAASPRDEPVSASRPAPTADDLLSKLPAEQRTPDAEAMVRAIAAGEMGPHQGWYRPGESRFGWDWLRSRDDADGDEVIVRDEFSGPAETFARLDRDRSGQIKQEDFNWSDESPYVQKLGQATQLFRRLDDSSDGRLDREEWLAAFERLADKEGLATPEALRGLLFPPARPWQPPPTEVLLAGLISGEIGSHMPGPAVGDAAPDFELRTHDGREVIRLSEFGGDKPVVLIFGSFT
jgi:AhpC/TSA family